MNTFKLMHCNECNVINEVWRIQCKDCSVKCKEYNIKNAMWWMKCD